MPPSREPHFPRIVNSELRLAGGLTERLFDLLGAIEATGSISGAAREIDMSYKGAWEMLERANNLSPQVLVNTEVGGRRGGGAQLTAPGRELLGLFNQARERHRQFLRDMNARLLGDPGLRVFFRRLEMRISACNQLFGRVERVRPGDAGAEVELGIKGGHSLAAWVTGLSAGTMKLRPGLEVVALIKAPQVVLVKGFGGYRLSAENQLAGTVERVRKGAVNAEVVVQLPGGDVIASVMTNESLEIMELAAGDAVTALFDPESVVLGLDGRPGGA